MYSLGYCNGNNGIISGILIGIRLWLTPQHRTLWGVNACNMHVLSGKGWDIRIYSPVENQRWLGNPWTRWKFYTTSHVELPLEAAAHAIIHYLQILNISTKTHTFTRNSGPRKNPSFVHIFLHIYPSRTKYVHYCTLYIHVTSFPNK